MALTCPWKDTIKVGHRGDDQDQHNDFMTINMMIIMVVMMTTVKISTLSEASELTARMWSSVLTPPDTSDTTRETQDGRGGGARGPGEGTEDKRWGCDNHYNDDDHWPPRVQGNNNTAGEVAGERPDVRRGRQEQDEGEGLTWSIGCNNAIRLNWTRTIGI